ncbi:hypothetical protein EYC80_001067 [Monilinia laxa]|uniref:Uncharacterized protein n=1 Tax=Monilinia laxa TaxID=61186 RepID=A0A5N6K835_MONLA|nr:hypothetical protein EYC80_001067 [Monilinia laxa]
MFRPEKPGSTEEGGSKNSKPNWKQAEIFQIQNFIYEPTINEVLVQDRLLISLYILEECRSRFPRRCVRS